MTFRHHRSTHAISMSVNCYPWMRANCYCTLHKLNVCGMQCTSYLHIGYLHCNIEAGCRGGRSKGLYTFQLEVYSCTQPATHPDGCQQIFADQLHGVTDRPHQAHLGAFGFFDTNNMPYFTHLSNGSLMPSHPRN